MFTKEELEFLAVVMQKVTVGIKEAALLLSVAQKIEKELEK